jgi:two-component system, sensor histidine kinase
VETALASLAHDIRTPLTGILALSDLLIASDLPERERGWARSIRSAADHLAQLTSIVLDAVKADRAGLAIRAEVFSPRKLAEAVAAALSARAGASGLTAEIAIAEDLPAEAVGDPVRLRAALENLTDNAVKFTARGRVRFEVAARPAPRGRLRLQFAVSDSGIGMTRTEIAKLFRPFAQASREVSLRYGGTGLGLALVKRLAKAMGGDLTVVSKKGEGSTFFLTVSAGKVPGAGPHAQSIAAPAATPNVPLRILCAEDNPYGRVVLNAMLTGLGHRVDFAGTGEAAVKSVAGGGYDCVLMDVTLPGIDGLEATRRIRALPGEAGRIPIIGISGRTSDADRHEARAAGMTDYLAKPVSPAALVEALQRLR